MNTTTRTFPRTLAEAFPDSLEGSIARAHYGAAITRYKRDLVPTRALGPVMALFFVGFLTGLLVAK